MSDSEVDWDDYGAEQSPICPWCGVSMLPPEVPGASSSCENADCDSYDCQI